MTLTRIRWTALAALTALAAPVGASAQASPQMNFFVASQNAAFGADQPAVVVADQVCATLGYGAGIGNLTWKAYLSDSRERARDRIGPGPWYNYYGVLIAESLDQLHSDENNLWEESAVTEAGDYAPEGLVIPKGSELDGSLYTRAGPFFCFGLP
jgi:hypothetical protein